MAVFNICDANKIPLKIMLYPSRSDFPDYSDEDTSGYIAIYDGTQVLYPCTSKNLDSKRTLVGCYMDANNSKRYIYQSNEVPVTPNLDNIVSSLTTTSSRTIQGTLSTLCPNGVRVYALGCMGADGSDGRTAFSPAGAGASGGSGGAGGKGCVLSLSLFGNTSTSITSYLPGGAGGAGGGGGAGGNRDANGNADANVAYGAGGKGSKGGCGSIVIFEIPSNAPGYAFSHVFRISGSYPTLDGANGSSGGTGDDATVGENRLGGHSGHICGSQDSKQYATTINGADAPSVPDSALDISLIDINLDSNWIHTQGMTYSIGSADLYRTLIALHPGDPTTEGLLLFEAL